MCACVAFQGHEYGDVARESRGVGLGCDGSGAMTEGERDDLSDTSASSVRPASVCAISSEQKCIKRRENKALGVGEDGGRGGRSER